MDRDVFWRLHPKEFYWLLDAKRPRKNYGNLTEEEVEELWREKHPDGADEDGPQDGGSDA